MYNILREVGAGKGRTTKKKEKNENERGGGGFRALVVGPLKNYFFLRLPYVSYRKIV